MNRTKQALKHIRVYGVDTEYLEKIIEHEIGVDTYAQAVHFLIHDHEQLQKDKNNMAEIKNLLAEAQKPVMKKLSDMEFEQQKQDNALEDIWES